MVRLGSFARVGMESCFDGDIALGVRAALNHYASALRAGLAPLGPPGFLPRLSCGDGAESAARDGATTLDLPLDPVDERTLAEQAASTGTPVTGLARHAVLSYLAEMERLGVVPREDPGHGLSEGCESGSAG